MNLRIFFDSITEGLLDHIKEPNTMLRQVLLHKEEFPSIEHIQAAIIGICETGGADKIRKKFYALKKGTSSNVIIADLGNLRPGMDELETCQRLKEVCSILLEKGIIPIIIGDRHSYDYGQFLAYENSGKLINFLNVDACIDLYSTEEFGTDKHHIHKILMHEPAMLFNYSHLAYQSFLCDPETVNVLEKLNYEAYRIGRIRENIKETEPVVRSADMMSFDLSAVRQNDAPGTINPQPFGLTGEEACQIAWYAGISPSMSSIGVYGYMPFNDPMDQTAGVAAVMMWYFVEGLGKKSAQFNYDDQQLTKYIVSLQEEPHKLVFYKHNISEFWWMEVPYPNKNKKGCSVVPCSYEDYQLAANKGEVPERWLQTHAKLV
ncbi:formimidoylglutamase [Cytophagaceae bacterium ABcell3]|nr:formimidoylglutamase [Cytophagaceae bacterium ABcell3]